MQDRNLPDVRFGLIITDPPAETSRSFIGDLNQPLRCRGYEIWTDEVKELPKFGTMSFETVVTLFFSLNKTSIRSSMSRFTQFNTAKNETSFHCG